MVSSHPFSPRVFFFYTPSFYRARLLMAVGCRRATAAAIRTYAGHTEPRGGGWFELIVCIILMYDRVYDLLSKMCFDRKKLPPHDFCPSINISSVTLGDGGHQKRENIKILSTPISTPISTSLGLSNMTLFANAIIQRNRDNEITVPLRRQSYKPTP